MLSDNRLRESRFHWHTWALAMYRRFNARLIERSEHDLFDATQPFLCGYEDIGSEEVVEKGARYLDPEFGGEAICSLGKAEDFAERGLAGIVSVVPFNCMPGQIVAAPHPHPAQPARQPALHHPRLQRLRRPAPRRSHRRLHGAGERAAARAGAADDGRGAGVEVRGWV